MPKIEKNLLLQEILKAELRVFKLEELKTLPWAQRSKAVALNKMLRALVQDGWLVAIKKGVYALFAIVSGGPIYEFEIAMKIVKPAMISYYSAFRYHGLTDQLPRDIFITMIKETATPKLEHQGKELALFLIKLLTNLFM